MFNLFSKKETEQPKQVMELSKTSNYPSIVDEIHNEFFLAGDKILEEAKGILDDAANKSIEKSRRLSALGFTKTNEVVIANNLINTKELAELVSYYQLNYPKYKFITENQVQEICKKYSLVCGKIGLYKGFVPEDKLSIIEQVDIKKEDADLIELVNTCVTHISIGYYKRSSITAKQQYLITGGEVAVKEPIMEDIKRRAISLGIKESDIYIERRNGGEPVSFKICAPLKDMDTTGMELKGYRLEEHIPDPVVLRPVQGGYLIVCAWGDEASDEIVVNQKLN